MPKLIFALNQFCANHPDYKQCTPDNTGAVIGAFAIAAVIVVLAIFGLWWRFGDRDSDSRLSRLFMWLVRRANRPRD